MNNKITLRIWCRLICNGYFAILNSNLGFTPTSISGMKLVPEGNYFILYTTPKGVNTLYGSHQLTLEEFLENPKKQELKVFLGMPESVRPKLDYKKLKQKHFKYNQRLR